MFHIFLFLLPTVQLLEDKIILPLRMPAVMTHTHDEYLMTPVRVDYDDAYIVGYTPQAESTKVHHILIYGCTAPAVTGKPYWNVGDMGGICDWEGSVNTILWAWALDAPKFDLPTGIGFHVGRNANINYILLQVHYKHVLESPDSSGVDVILTTVAPPRLAAIYLFASSSTIIPPDSVIKADTTCTYTDTPTMVPFAYRTHTHTLGVRASAWREREGTWTLLGSGDPQKPQMFYMMEGDPHPIRTGDILHARCVFNSAGKNDTVIIGPTGEDEMCNFYMMYHMNASSFKLEDGCYEEHRFTVPVEVRIPLEESDRRSPVYSINEQWTSPLFETIGQVGGLSHDTNQSQLVVFHRAGNDWSAKQWFDESNNVLYKEELIEEDPIVFIHPQTGAILHSLGASFFIMPHGVYLDKQDNVWVTDVALHQVMKFNRDETAPSLVLGTKFVPGNGSTHFCKPTGVVVDGEGFVYVSDGYCNSRVVKFNGSGEFVAEYGTAGDALGVPGVLGLVHDITINQEDQLMYVADRERGQVHVMTTKGEFTAVYAIPGKPFALDFVPALNQLAVVNISDISGPSKIMLVDPKSGKTVSSHPSSSPMKMPHSLTFVNGSFYAGEIAKPFTVYKMSASADGHKPRPILSILSETIPPSFIAVIAVLAAVPLAYLAVVIVGRCRQKRNINQFDKNGFQKLLRDYDSSEEEEDLVFKNSKIYR